jgi:aryl-alcohol dehydrogenase-like predicted oxidoreductase
MPVPERTLVGNPVFPISLGCMGLTYHGTMAPEVGVSIIHAALDGGINVLDTADIYGTYGNPGMSERRVREALDSWSGDRDQITVLTKGGNRREADDTITQHGDRAYLRAACEASLRALGVDQIDLYLLHRPDADVPFEDTVATLAELRDEGKVREVGLSNAGRAHIATASAVFPVAAVEVQFSPVERAGDELALYCGQSNIPFLSWSPLGGAGRVAELPTLVPSLAEIATQRGVTAYQVALAWHLAFSPTVIPVVGCMSVADVEQAIAAAGIELSADEVASISTNSR